jgi:endonuclease G
VTLTPLWAAEHLTREAVEASRTFGRTSTFHAERALPKGERAELKDFEGSACDRGHMAPSEDMPDPATQREASRSPTWRRSTKT